jgi:hypothetical protein
MVGESHEARDRGAGLLERREEPLGLADAAEGIDALPLPDRTPVGSFLSEGDEDLGGMPGTQDRSAAVVAAEDRDERLELLRARSMRHDEQIGPGEPAERFAQQPRRQDGVAAEGIDRIEQNHVEVAAEATMLESVIEKDEVGMEAADRQLPPADTIGIDDDGKAGNLAGDEDRLVSRLFDAQQDVHAVRHDPRPGSLRAISAAQDQGPDARGEKRARDVDDDRRLAGPSDSDVADADDGDRQAMDPRPAAVVETVAGRGGEGVQGRSGPQSRSRELGAGEPHAGAAPGRLVAAPFPEPWPALLETAASRTGSTSRRVRSSAPAFLATSRRAFSPAIARSSGSAARRAKSSTRAAAPVTWKAPPAASRRPAASRVFSMCGPKIGATPSAAASMRLWPPIGAMLPPTKATEAAR